MVDGILTGQEIVDVTPVQATQLLKLQRDILEKVALGQEHDYQPILNQLCKATESLISDALASIMMFDEAGELYRLSQRLLCLRKRLKH